MKKSRALLQVSRQLALNSRRVTRVSSATLVDIILPCFFCLGLHGYVIGCKKSCTLVLLQVTFQDEVGEDQLRQLKQVVVMLTYVS